MLAGLGALTLNAIKDRTVTTEYQTVTSHRSFGYLRANLLRYAYAHVAASLRVGRIQAHPVQGHRRSGVRSCLPRDFIQHSTPKRTGTARASERTDPRA